jgi:hypothetical protein
MAKQSLDKLLEEIIKNVHKTSATYRNFTSNKRIHGITVNATDIASQVEQEFMALLSVEKLEAETKAFIQTESVKFSKKLHAAFKNFDPKNTKWTEVSKLSEDTTNFTFNLSPKADKKPSSVFNAFKKIKQAEQIDFNANLEARLKIENADVAKSRSNLPAAQRGFLDIGHEGGSSISAQRLAAVSSTIGRFEITTGDGGSVGRNLSAEIQKALDSMEWSIVKSEGDPKDTVSIKMESKKINRDNKDEVLQLNKTITAIIEEMKEDITLSEGSDSSITRRQKIILKAFSDKLKGTKGVKLVGFKDKLDPSYKGKNKKKPNKAKSSVASLGSKGSKKSRRKRQANKGVSSSPLAMITMLNKRLPDTVRSNMGAPKLENVTGRFATSVRVTDIMQTPQGFPSIGYTYQRDPYQVFETGSSGSWSNEYRDPRKLIDKSIRELAATVATGRFYTRRT